ncbi:MAG TPA: hypothetical protein VES19_09710 [Candidatus Limnocylindrales bacterium]|nr:hypothetical protein [Candidatus Limnocylindrales bacterium]
MPHDVVEPSVVYEPPAPRRSHGGDPAMRKDLGLVLFVVGALVIGFVTWNLAGAVTSAALTPPLASPVALATSSSTPIPTPTRAAPSGSPSTSAPPSVAPSPAATPKPERKAVDVKIEPKPAAVFVTEAKNTWCAAAAVQIALNVNGPATRIDTSRAGQARIRELQVDLTTRRDSRNGGAGPLGMVATLEELGKVDYELRIYDTRAEALRDSARAVSETGHAVILLAWRGAHAWVMTGYRADADPTVFKNARVTGAYIIDPWYPRVSRIWGRSDKPGVYQNTAEMTRNYRPWKRPEARYPGRDGNFLAIIPLN